MSNQANPMAVVREADDPEMQQWAYEATAAIEAAGKATKTTLERYRDAGEALFKAKKKGGHGKWMAWLKRHGIAPTTAGRAIKVFSSWAKLTNLVNLTEAFKVMAEAPEETEKAKPVEVAPLCARCQRNGPTTMECKACEEAEVAWRQSRKAKGGQREAGDDTDSEKEAKAKEKEKAKNGRVSFDWKSTDAPVGTLIRQVDTFGNAFGVKEQPDVAKLRLDLADWHDRFKAVYERVTKERAPETAA